MDEDENGVGGDDARRAEIPRRDEGACGDATQVAWSVKLVFCAPGMVNSGRQARNDAHSEWHQHEQDWHASEHPYSPACRCGAQEDAATHGDRRI